MNRAIMSFPPLINQKHLVGFRNSKKNVDSSSSSSFEQDIFCAAIYRPSPALQNNHFIKKGKLENYAMNVS